MEPVAWPTSDPAIAATIFPGDKLYGSPLGEPIDLQEHVPGDVESIDSSYARFYIHRPLSGHVSQEAQLYPCFGRFASVTERSWLLPSASSTPL